MRSVLGEKEKNFDKIRNLLSDYKKVKSDLIILPELFATGWYCDIYEKVAETEENSVTSEFLKGIAIEHNSNLIGGSFVRKDNDGSIKNTCPVFDRAGNLIAKYDKMHLYSYLGDTENLHSTAGSKPVIAKTDIGKIGLTVCYDIRFPEIYRCYAYGGADLLVNVAAWPKSRKVHWETLTRARAIENQSFMAAVSQTGEIQNGVYNLGYSAVYDPLGRTVASAAEEETVISAEIDFAEMKNLRENVKTLSDRHEKYLLEE